MAQAKLMQCDTVKNVSQEIVNMHFTGKTAGVVNCETTLWSCSHFWYHMSALTGRILTLKD